MSEAGDWTNLTYTREKAHEFFTILMVKPGQKANLEELYETDLSLWPRDQFETITQGLLAHCDLLECCGESECEVHLTSPEGVSTYCKKLEENRVDLAEFGRQN